MFIESSNDMQQYIYPILKSHSSSRILEQIYIHVLSDVKFLYCDFSKEKRDS